MQLIDIGQDAGNCRIWIDLESGVRTDDRFDLEKVSRVLSITKPYILQKGTPCPAE